MVYVFLAPGFETVEALTPVDYLRRAKVEVKTVAVAAEGRTVLSSHHVPVTADIAEEALILDDCEMIVLPGGKLGTMNLEASETVSRAIAYCMERGLPIGAICAAPSILGHKRLLDGKKATCYPTFAGELGKAEVTLAPAEIDGNFVTGRGAGASNQFAFALIERLRGKEAAREVSESVVY